MYRDLDSGVISDSNHGLGRWEEIEVDKTHVTVYWWKTFSSYGKGLVQQKMSCKIMLKDGLQCAPRKTEADYSWPMWVTVKRFAGRWMLTPYFHEEIIYNEYDEEDGSTPERHGHTWLVYDHQPEEVWTWLDFDDSSRGVLCHKYQHTINDGRLVNTPCGPQVNPEFRSGTNVLCDGAYPQGCAGPSCGYCGECESCCYGQL